MVAPRYGKTWKPKVTPRPKGTVVPTTPSKPAFKTVKLNSGYQGVPIPRDPTGKSTYSTTQTQTDQRAWNAQNPNATNYFHAYATSPEDLGRMMREDPAGYAALYRAYNPIGGGQLPADLSGLPGSGGGGYGGGGGGGGAGPQGLDQATLDYLASIIGQGRPKDINYQAIDLPEPTWDNALYEQARGGVTSGINDIRTRGNTAIDNAIAQVNRYQNPYAGGLQTRTPDLQSQMSAMMAANRVGTPGQVTQTDQEGATADRGLAATLAMLAATDERRKEGNLMGLEGDRRVMDQNLGIEGNMLGLGVNMAEQRGKTAWQQQVDQIRQQEAMQNWQRQNTVGDTNVGANNAWMQNALNSWLGLIGQKAPGVTLPTNGTLPWAV